MTYATEIRSLLEELARRASPLTALGGHVRYDAPDGAMTADLIGRIRKHKAELLELLRTLGNGRSTFDLPDPGNVRRRYCRKFAPPIGPAGIGRCDEGLPAGEESPDAWHTCTLFEVGPARALEHQKVWAALLPVPRIVGDERDG